MFVWTNCCTMEPQKAIEQIKQCLCDCYGGKQQCVLGLQMLKFTSLT